VILLVDYLSKMLPVQIEQMMFVVRANRVHVVLVLVTIVLNMFVKMTKQMSQVESVIVQTIHRTLIIVLARSIVLTDIVDISVWEDHVVAEVDRSIVVLMHQRQVIVEHVHKR